MAESLEVIKGTLDVLILKSLSWGPGHGYAVSRWIRDVTDEALSIEEGALYPALHRLEQRGWITAEWGLSDNNRRARYYKLTPQGPPAAAPRGVELGPVCRGRLEGVDRHRAAKLGKVSDEAAPCLNAIGVRFASGAAASTVTPTTSCGSTSRCGRRS